MLPDSHSAPIQERRACLRMQEPVDALLLADAFSDFIEASARLEGSYRELQQEVALLGLELTARNAALNASVAENERMRAALEQIVDSMPCGVLVLDADGAVAMMNAESARLLELEGKPARNLSEVAASSRIQPAAFNGAWSEAEQELAQEGPSGRRWLGIRKRALSAAGTQQTILILRDITVQKQAEEERESARKAMALAEVAALLAHEIRNPLASLELFAGLIADDPERRAEWTQHLRAGIRSLAGTVTNVLSFHSLGRMQRSPLDLGATIGAAAEFVRPIAEQNGLLLSFVAAPEIISVLANQGALQQVVLNLVSNAIRYTPSGGRIALTVSKAADCALLTCMDTGSGMNEAQLAHIFEAGYSGSGQSCGLGLAVCRQIVTQHGGQMRCTSRAGLGTTFYVELPLV